MDMMINGSISSRRGSLGLGRGDAGLCLTGQADALFRGQEYPRTFSFDDGVAPVFDDMVSRSVPLYGEVQVQTARWAQLLYRRSAAVVDIGCSTGTTLELLSRVLPLATPLVGIEPSLPMMARAREKLSEASRRPGAALSLVERSVVDVDFPPTFLGIAHYVLQFIDTEKRRDILQRLCDATVPGGGLLLSEKVRSADTIVQTHVTALYEEFKLSQGYLPEEVERKRHALTDFLIPWTLEQYCDTLRAVGYSHVEILLKWNPFVTVLAVKAPR